VCLIAQRAVRDVRDLTKLRCPVLCRNPFRNALDLVKGVEKFFNIHASDTELHLVEVIAVTLLEHRRARNWYYGLRRRYAREFRVRRAR
jgi:hypothetical protein